MRLENLELPENLYWQNEFEHKSLAQSVERSVAGGAVIEQSPLAYGQKIKLTGAWASRAEIISLKTLENTNSVMAFTCNDATSHSVVFDIEAGGVAANLLSPEVAPDSDTLYELTINLLTVEPVV